MHPEITSNTVFKTIALSMLMSLFTSVNEDHLTLETVSVKIKVTLRYIKVQNPVLIKTVQKINMNGIPHQIKI